MLLREQIQTESDAHMKDTLMHRFQELIPRLCVALGKAEALQPTYSARQLEEEYWRVATAVELAAQSQEWAMGRQAMMVLFSLMNEIPVDLYWMLQSTFTQQRSVLNDLKKEGIEVDTVFEWWVEFYCQTFDQNLESRDTFHVLGFENKAPATISIKNHQFTHTTIAQSASKQISVPVLQIGAENAKDRRFLRLSVLKGKIVVDVIQVLFPNKKLCLQFNQALIDAKKVHRNPARLREAHSVPGEEATGTFGEQVDIDDNSVKVTARNKKVLGEGTFANVYQTTNLKTGKQIAVKVLKSKMFMSMEHDWSEVTAEVQTMSTFQHKNIVKYLGCKRGARDFYIFMEHMVGGSLQDLLRNKGALDDFAITMYTRDILSALTYLHSHDIIHRDIKAGNVLLDEHLRVAKLADFGTSIKSKAKDPKAPKTVDSAAAGEDCVAVGGRHGSLLGFTPAFVSPEVVVNGNITDAVDVWALGCTVIQMVTSTQNHCALHAWEHAGDQLPLHQHKESNMLQGSGLHRGEGDPCWVCALERGDSPAIPSDMSPAGQNFLELCLNPDPTQRARVSALEECAYISAGGGVLVNEVDQVTSDEKGILWTEDGELQCDGLAVTEVCSTLLEARLVKGHEAFVLYSQAAITSNCTQFEKFHALGQHLLFDVGANPSMEVLQLLASLGVHATLSSTPHLSLVSTAGFNHEACMIDGTANMKHSSLQAAINENMSFKVHSKLDLTRLREASELNETRTAVKLLLPSESGRPEGQWFQHSLEDLLQATLTCDLFRVDGLHCEVFDADEALCTLQKELAKVKSHFSEDRLTTVCLGGLDTGHWNTPECSRLTTELAEGSQLFLEISHDLLANSTLLVDRVLEVSGQCVTVQEGLFHPDAQLWPLSRGVNWQPVTEVEFQVNSFSKHATLDPCVRGFTQMPRDRDHVAFFLENISTCGALWSSVRQFMVNKNTKAIEPMQTVKLELHNSQIYTTATSRISVMKSISCPDLARRLSEHDLRCGLRTSNSMPPLGGIGEEGQ
eukprot:TRINITY_DN16602_c0_g1_i2.p1 TRINITY_DN16602_c0_g1~~TRINITY_DN16602_c0_g1_i2.p1  ORF type:complete len:1020 (-),score=284.96 TRINITY_DN16602_c0_g1_i2:59-3118(-)